MQGEAETPPPPALRDTARDWPGQLLQALRLGRWRIGQVDLVGKVECRTPDPIRLLMIGGRYEITDRELQAALGVIGEDDAATIRRCLHRDISYSVQGGTYVSHAPTFSPSELQLFDQLWQVLAENGWLRRLPPPPTDTAAVPATE